MRGISFGMDWWAALFAIGLGLLFAFLYRQKKSEEPYLLFSHVRAFHNAPLSWRKKFSFVPALLQKASLFLVLFAFSDPLYSAGAL